MQELDDPQIGSDDWLAQYSEQPYPIHFCDPDRGARRGPFGLFCMALAALIMVGAFCYCFMR
jgi:hypothetical protein